MRVEKVTSPSSIDPDVQAWVLRDVHMAFAAIATIDGRFVVNDTPWCALNDRGKVTPCVVNAAQFISSRFLKKLGERGWVEPFTANDQEIDAYVELPTKSVCVYGVNEEDFPWFFAAHVATSRDGAGPEGQVSEPLDQRFGRLYHTLAQRASPVVREAMDASVATYLQPRGTLSKIRIGLEFETGNIASSFRAITKLSNLHKANLIDAAVFVTCIDKRTAGRIWPISNRNGSFEELERRGHRGGIIFPLWEFGFAPDAYSANAPYLAASGSTYQIIATDDYKTVEGATYRVFRGDRGKELLR